jgi:hypothetical protein
MKLRIHGVQLVLDPDYLPQTVDETDAFVEMQNFVFGVFNDILLPPRVRGILHRHVNELDAQAVYRNLVDLYGKGINAQITATAIETKLTLYLFTTSNPRQSPRTLPTEVEESVPVLASFTGVGSFNEVRYNKTAKDPNP